MVTIGATDTRERVLADNQFGSGTPATWYFGLSTTTPADDGTGFTEPVGGAYARVAMTNNATNFPVSTTASGVTTKANGAKITWPNPTGLWGLIGYVGVFTAASGGTPEYWFKMDQSFTVQSGNTPVEFDIGFFVTSWGS